jgi:hypothetical protein
MKTATRTQGRCRVCGFTEIRTDEVIDHGVVFLAECPRCEYRWTSSEPPVEVRSIAQLRPAVRYHRVPARVVREAPAA